jgi:glutamate dehydrogenase
MQEKLKAVCNQLISLKDLTLHQSILKELKTEDLTAMICEGEACEIKIFSKNRFAISDVIPILGDFGFVTVSEITYQADYHDSHVYVTKLLLEVKEEEFLVKHQENIKDLLLKSLQGDIRSSSLFKLVYLENFCARGILLFRAIIAYAEQLILEFNQKSLEECIVKYPHISGLFLSYFVAKFDPELKEHEKRLEKISVMIDEALKEVENISDDRVLKLIFEILQSLVRTNYFTKRETLALKVDVSNLRAHLKGIQPHFETFVYAHDMSGTHLRISKVCRGGLRWSNRKEDFRVEIKSLMATQEAKNSVIVPKGAKGGFVIFRDETDISPEVFKGYYSRFIHALLDVVDNQKEGQVIQDSNIVSYDGEDSYFVVAADRGTSSMSDTANAIARERGFWLDDAFASGSSTGYHHKKLGITAKGAIKAVQRYFIERGIDFYKESISIVGVGSMSGDVFGNGLLESKAFKLIGAISHDEIFIDPEPDINIAYKERKRLFEMKRGKWSQYDLKKISKGGGVFKRSAKSILLSTEIKTLIGTKKMRLSGEELAKELLKLSVDMLYFGGVGTYVKSPSESNIALGDKENEYVRIDAEEIGAFCVCEGANLALTMQARIDYALRGGKINLDSIDNSAGVDTSDHEVNLKILLNGLKSKSLITKEEKNSTLQGISDYVVNAVLWTNYLQSLSISLDKMRSQKKCELFKQVLVVLERELEVFKRSSFNIPKERDFDEVIDEDGEIVRPVLATMTLYAKIFLQDILNDSTLYHDNFFDRYLFKYFPKSFVSIYEDEILAHPLKKEIMSMIIANKIINNAGVTFVADFYEKGIEKFLEKIKAYLITNQLFDANDIRYEIYRGDYSIDVKKQYEMLLKIEKKIAFNIEALGKNFDIQEINTVSMLESKNQVCEVIKSLDIKTTQTITENEKINHFFNELDYMKFISTILKISSRTNFHFHDITVVFYKIIQKLEINTLMDIIEKIATVESNEEMLLLQYKQLLDGVSSSLSKSLLHFMRKDEDVDSAIEGYLIKEGFDIAIYHDKVDRLKRSENVSFLDLSLVINELLLISE